MKHTQDTKRKKKNHVIFICKWYVLAFYLKDPIYATTEFCNLLSNFSKVAVYKNQHAKWMSNLLYTESKLGTIETRKHILVTISSKIKLTVNKYNWEGEKQLNNKNIKNPFLLVFIVNWIRIIITIETHFWYVYEGISSKI